MSKYKYKCPTERGYIRIKSKEEIKGFGIKSKWNVKREFYRNGNHIYYENVTPIYVKLLETVLLPIYISVYSVKGFFNIMRDLLLELYQLWSPKRTGNFTSSAFTVEYDK